MNTELLKRLRESVHMFYGRMVGAEQRGKSLDPIYEEFVRFVANVSADHGPEFASFCVLRMPHKDKASKSIAAAGRLRHEPRVREWLALTKEALKGSA